MRLYATSDLHTDFRENWLLLKQLSEVAYRNDALIVAGDIADKIETIENTLALLRSKFRQVFYLPGNHELWVRNDNCDSIEKLQRVLEVCEKLSVHVRPAKAAGLWVVPLFSWYDAAFDVENAGEHNSDADAAELEGWADFYLCKWPEGIKPLHAFFLDMNTPHIRPYDAPVVSFSHFVPRRELLPSREHLRFKSLPLVAGSLALDDQIRALKSVVHVFGHSHISCDKVIDGVRYVQNALRYPRERSSSSLPIKMIWDSSMPAEKLASA
jgi:Icc-related predicted phosphoesterase